MIYLALIGLGIPCAIFGWALYDCKRHERDRESDETGDNEL